VHTLSAARNMILDGRLRYHRQALDVPVSLSPAPKKRLKAHLTNLSQGGMGIRLKPSVPVTGELGLSFMLPGTKRSVKVKGEIAWADQQGNAGIRFLEINPDLKRDLQLWLEQQYLMH
jgi:c-di-GMP-binding flagellar brake protein YcgR